MSLSANESMRLIERAQAGDAQAMSLMVEENLALVKFVVKRYIGRNVEYDDLLQLGSMGLVKAIQNFNTAYEVRFSTYAVPVILGEVRRYLRDNCLIRVSRTIRENALRIYRFKEQYEKEHGEEPTLAAIAEALKMDAEDALLALDSLAPTRSLSEPIGTAEGSLTLGDTVGADPTDEMDDRIALEQMLSGLDERERIILERRYYASHTQSAIAADLGMTQVQVSRLEGKIIKRLRETAKVANV